jgi:hypothetical protein
MSNATEQHVTLQNETLAVRIEPAAGGRIASIALHAGVNVLFQNKARTGGMDRFYGGWQCMFPNAGAASAYEGIAHPAHGAAFADRWELRADDESSVELEIRAPGDLQLSRRIELYSRRPALFVRDRILNVGKLTTSFSFGHHPVFVGRRDSVLDLPAGIAVLEAPADAQGVSVAASESLTLSLADLLGTGREAFWALACSGPGSARLRASSAESSGAWTAASMAWDARALPYLWVWIRKQPRRRDGSDVISVGIEPVSASSPTGLADAVRRGEQLILEPGRACTFGLDLELALLDESSEATYRDQSID